MENFEIKAKTRKNLGKKVKQSRLKGILPAVVYGKGFDNSSIEIDLPIFEKLFKSTGYSSLIDLAIDEQKPFKVLVKDVSYDIFQTAVDHVDFYRINMNEPVQAKVSIHFIGESSYIKEHGGNMIKNLDSVVIECLPADLIQSIIVDLSEIKTLTDSIKIKDLKVPSGIKIVRHPEELVATVIIKANTEKEYETKTAEVVATPEAPVAEVKK